MAVEKQKDRLTDGQTDGHKDKCHKACYFANKVKFYLPQTKCNFVRFFLLLLPILLEIRGKWLFGIRLSFHDNCGMLFVCIRKHINLILTNLVPYIWLTNRMNDWLTNWLNIWTNFHRMLFYFSLFIVNLTHLTRFWNF